MAGAAGSLVLHDSTGGARPVLVRLLSSAASETDTHPFATDAEQWLADHLTQEEARTDAIGLALGVLSLSFVSPEVARARLELGQAFFTFNTGLLAVKGLRSADNEDIVKLLGRLGTASMELAHSTDIDAVLQHAGVTLTMPGGNAQLAKWHRLGHLQSVAGGFAEVMAKPSTIATVKENAKELLLEAEEQAATRESRRKVLDKLDEAVGFVHKDLLEATAAELPERGDQSVEDFVFAQMQQPGGLSAAARMAASSPAARSVVSQAVDQPWWLLWPGSEARKGLASRMARDIAALTHPTNGLGETNGRAVFGPRGVGKTSMLAAGAVAAGVFSRISSLPEGSRRIVPMYLHMGRAAYLYERHESAAKHGGAWLSCASPLMMLMDRAVQLAGFKPRIDVDPDARKWDGSSWWSVPSRAGKFLQEHNLSIFLVIDEADEPYKKGGQFAEELRDFIDQKWNMCYYVSGSAARMRDLLYHPRQLEGSGMYHWEDFKHCDMHSDKLAAQPALPPIQHLDEFAEAIKCIGDEFAAPKLFRAACEWRSEETARLRFAELVLQHGGVLRSLVADKKRTDTELPLFKMRSDISADAGRLAIARTFYDRLIRKWPGLKSESVVGMLASGSLGSVTDVGIDFAELVATFNERVASSHGQQHVKLAATDVESTLSSLSDAGVLTLSGSRWVPASWTSLLAILLSVEGNVELPYEQRVHLRYPTIGSTTTEPAMADAFVKRGQQSTVFVDEVGHQPSAELLASLWKSMRALGRTDSHGLPAIEQVSGPRKGRETLPTGSWTSFLGPTPDSGVDVVILTTADASAHRPCSIWCYCPKFPQGPPARS
ncbi:hypothetical protein FNF27_08339 [Cafeteria roenbergensis]|uniref:Uncharacterized protein n=1 Tax=Cafeteria roenbergensis TaxID=33653 RepID=A0A5A8D4X9_CAFRO|nr:hypothetical protein FNF27_08339 [Cafeteria roenbergensis]